MAIRPSNRPLKIRIGGVTYSYETSESAAYPGVVGVIPIQPDDLSGDHDMVYLGYSYMDYSQDLRTKDSRMSVCVGGVKYAICTKMAWDCTLSQFAVETRSWGVTTDVRVDFQRGCYLLPSGSTTSYYNLRVTSENAAGTPHNLIVKVDGTTVGSYGLSSAHDVRFLLTPGSHRVRVDSTTATFWATTIRSYRALAYPIPK